MCNFFNESNEFFLTTLWRPYYSISINKKLNLFFLSPTKKKMYEAIASQQMRVIVCCQGRYLNVREISKGIRSLNQPPFHVYCYQLSGHFCNVSFFFYLFFISSIPFSITILFFFWMLQMIKKILFFNLKIFFLT